jgi:hypothetical protein
MASQQFPLIKNHAWPKAKKRCMKAREIKEEGRIAVNN